MRGGYIGAKMAWVLAESQISGDEDQRVGDVGLGTRQTREAGGGGLDWRLGDLETRAGWRLKRRV